MASIIANKNMLNLDLVSFNIKDIECPNVEDIETKEEAVDWSIYELKNLQIIIKTFVYHQIKTQQIIDYCERTKSYILNVMISSRKRFNDIDFSEIISLIDIISHDCDALRTIKLS